MRRGVFVFMLIAGAARAEPPQSAIDWLSEAIESPPNFVIAPPSSLTRPVPEFEIIETPLSLVSRDAAGLLAPNVTGFSHKLWGDNSAEQVIKLINTLPLGDLPALRGLFRQVLLAQADPPLGASLTVSPLLARIDRLIEIGALDEAETLITLAGVSEPEIFRRWFEITLLGNRTIAPCNTLARAPALSDDIATRVICLARTGDWNAAAITLSLAATIGDIPRPHEEMLIRFLDPELFDGTPEPEIPEPLGVVDFFLRESLGMSRPNSGLPLAFLNVDLGLRAPPRLRMLAAEKLVQSGAIPSTLLFAAYRGGRAASSGGIWGRAEAVQNLDRALVEQDSTTLVDALETAYVAFSDANLLVPLAEEYANALAHYPRDATLAPVAHRIRRLLLLAGAPISAWLDDDTEDNPTMELATVLASNLPLLGLPPYDDPRLVAVFSGFAGLPPARSNMDAMMTLIKSGNQGEVIVKAATLLSKGQEADPQDIHQGLFLLNQMGLHQVARNIALQILLIDREPA